MGTMATCSFFPSKNLGAYGDGGAILTPDPELEAQARMITNHGGRHKYYNEAVGLNSRLDALQAAILEVKLRHLESFTERRRAAAARYHSLFESTDEITCPHEADWGRHVYHQYVIRTKNRDDLTDALSESGIPYGIYYPVPLHQQPVFGGPENSVHLPRNRKSMCRSSCPANAYGAYAGAAGVYCRSRNLPCDQTCPCVVFDWAKLGWGTGEKTC